MSENKKENMPTLGGIIEKLKSAFSEAESIAWENAPDGDEEFMEEFEDNMQLARNDFDAAIRMLQDGGFTMIM